MQTLINFLSWMFSGIGVMLFEKSLIKQSPSTLVEVCIHPNQPPVGILQNPMLNLVFQRFILLFEMHGIPLSAIPKFLGEPWNITLADLKNLDTLLPKLTEELLEHTCNLFGVRREW